MPPSSGKKKKTLLNFQWLGLNCLKKLTKSEVEFSDVAIFAIILEKGNILLSKSPFVSWI